ncbi:23S rRNA (uracil(1939)-C(5))-methyltransferase RlmD [Candidatus Gracilibacteria bacterium]|nr:23S rRNA (uracil(1939)-C(5))-methyltransferase RlmD [Candidatus Gracilibacteria bacterium]
MSQKGTTLENILVEKLILGGIGLGRDTSGKKVLISGGAIPESVVDVRVVKNRSNRIEGQILRVVKKSPLEARLPENFQVYGGCRWLPIPHEKQLEMKEQQIREVFVHNPEMVKDATWHPIVASPEVYGYRNKVEFSWGKYISAREGVDDKYRFGFHESGQFDRIVNCTYCVLGDEVVNDIFRAFDAFARENRLPTYDVKTNIGFWRHLVIRRSKKTGETMVIVSVNTMYLGEGQQEEFRKALRSFISGFSTITSAYLLHNTGNADVVQGKYDHIGGTSVITEKLFDLEFEISPRSFFQTNTLGAEELYRVTGEMIRTENPVVFDLYAGTGTIGMVLAHRAKEVYSVEIVPEASEDNIRNLKKNNITNVTVVNAPVEKVLEQWKQEGKSSPDVIVIDPPRAGMHPDAPGILRDFNPREIIYVSCNPATLARDIPLIAPNGEYRVTDITPVDMFPHTHHIEVVLRLERV